MTDTYDPLFRHLETLRRDHSAEVILQFKTIERLIGRPLPASARKYSAWWGNNRVCHVQAAAWMDAGFKATPRLIEESATFRLEE